MKQIGFNLDDERLEKIEIIKFVNNKSRKDLILEGIDYVIDDKFDNCVKQIKNQVERLENDK